MRLVALHGLVGYLGPIKHLSVDGFGVRHVLEHVRRLYAVLLARHDIVLHCHLLLIQYCSILVRLVCDSRLVLDTSANHIALIDAGRIIKVCRGVGEFIFSAVLSNWLHARLPITIVLFVYHAELFEDRNHLNFDWVAVLVVLLLVRTVVGRHHVRRQKLNDLRVRHLVVLVWVYLRQQTVYITRASTVLVVSALLAHAHLTQQVSELGLVQIALSLCVD